MAIVESFELDPATMDIKMFQGDTKAFKFTAHRKSGTAWTENDRMLFTVKNAAGDVVLQRIYRLDTDLGNGKSEIQFHNNDTDEWENGIYNAERRYIINCRWDGEAPEGDCVNALAVDARIVDGDVVRVPETGQFTISLNDIYGEV